jgi:hypothetical protein
MKNTGILDKNRMKNSDGVLHVASCYDSYRIASNWSQKDFLAVPIEQASYLQLPIEPHLCIAVTNVSSIPQTVFLYFTTVHLYTEDGQELKISYTTRNASGGPPYRKHFKILQPSQTFKTRLSKECFLCLFRQSIDGSNDENFGSLHLVLTDYGEQKLDYNLSIKIDKNNLRLRRNYRFWMSLELWCDDEEWCSDRYIYSPITSSYWNHIDSMPHTFIKTWTGHLLTKPVEFTLNFSG